MPDANLTSGKTGDFQKIIASIIATGDEELIADTAKQVKWLAQQVKEEVSKNLAAPQSSQIEHEFKNKLDFLSGISSRLI